MVVLDINEKKFLRGLKKMVDADDDAVKMIYTLYRKLINNPEVLNEYDGCKCPGVIRTMAFELVLHYLKHKKEIC